MTETPTYIDNESGQPVAQDVADTLWELEQEGHIPDGVHKKEDAEKKEEKKEDEDPTKKDDKKEEKDPENKDEKDEENNNEGKEDEDVEGEDGEGEEKGGKREAKFVPIWTMKKALKELEDTKNEEIEAIKKSAGIVANENVDDKGVVNTEGVKKEAAKIAEQYGIKPEAVEAIIGVSIKNLESQFKDKFEKIDQVEKKHRTELEDNLYNKDFDTSLKLFSPEQQEHLKGKAQQIKQQAYTQEYGGTPLRTIMIEFLHDNPVPEKKQSAMKTRPTGGGSGADKGDVDFANVTEADIEAMNEETSDRYFDWLEQNRKGNNGWQTSSPKK